MAIHAALSHVTQYEYARPASLGPQTIRLRPAPHSRTRVVSYSLNVEPGGHFLNWLQDPQSNWLARVVFHDKVPRFRVAVDLVADMTVINPFDFFIEEAAEQFPFRYDPLLSREIAPFLVVEPMTKRFEAWLATVDRTPRRTIDFIVELNRKVYEDVSYIIRMEPGVQTPEQTLERGKGSCRDSGWLLVQAARRLGLAARFVSGYLIQLKPDVPSLDGPSGPAEDFCDLHAWCEVYLPGAGWVGLDPTSGLLATESHVPLAATPDPGSAAPITGALEKVDAEFSYAMEVSRVHEDPRVTWPYTDAQWRAIDQLAYRIDDDLSTQDVRLTAGGEPTFVSIDDMEGEEWTVGAVGPTKRRLSEQLVRRLHARFAPGGLLHFGQGKWYPGEQLPRWTLACYWRRDGQPIWRDPRWIANEEHETAFGIDDAERFLEVLCRRLEVDPGYAVPTFEDPVHFMHREGQLPVNVDPADSKLEDAEERARLRRVFVERGLSHPVGFVLPLSPEAGPGDEMVWHSALWMLRGKHLLLIPGDSPIGLRLPLERLPWSEAGAGAVVIQRDPMARTDPLPAREALSARRGIEIREQVRGRRDDGGAATAEAVSLRDRMPATDDAEGADTAVRTAMCIEPRDGRLHLFIPPLPTIESYLALVAAIEDVAEALETPVIVEGEHPPTDARIASLKIAPDPGVLEVNVQPASSWGELSHIVETLYEEARLCRLGTEKFMLDGRHCGTGGGNHIVLGGAKPTDSPFLRRPDLLRSLATYWLNHPSLSFLFSGMFVGPTSQAPRIDEARHESVYELEVAFAELDRQQQVFGQCPPWIVDRLFRNLFIDVSGNTHRAEFCIDKLYSPDSSSGRLGLIEFRAFEMPPHPRMSLAQHLLLRALVAWFWREPYRARPVRWGTQLHDRFMLPQFVWEDFEQVIDDLRGRAGYALDAAWFHPHYEFRFPVMGSVELQGLTLTLRQAIEPWHVLGEQPGAGGTARYVDSSLERLEVAVDGALAERWRVLCNGRALPLRPTRSRDRLAAGVRYRAWQPPHCLHPTIGVDAPLVFDLYDTWNDRSIGGCTYHVAHPGGRSHEAFPVNAMEAESRRHGRFWPFGHTPAPMPPPPVESNPEYPCTLDLRRRPA